MAPGRSWLTVVLAAVCVALAGCGASQSRFQSHIDRGKAYFADEKLAKASVEFRNALQIEPQSAEAAYLTGRVQELRGQYDEAVEFYQSAIESDPGFDPARASLAKTLILGGAFERALHVIEPGLDKHPDNPDLLAARAAARHEVRDEEGALADAHRAVQIAPRNENAVSILAGLYQANGDYPKALDVVNAAVRLSPDSVDLHQTLAMLDVAIGKHVEAQEQLRRAVELRPDKLPLRLQLASRLAMDHQTDEAQRVLGQAVEALPADTGAKLALVDFLANQRSLAEGELKVREFIARDSNNMELRFGLGALQQRSGAIEEAIVTFRDIMRLSGKNADGLLARDRIAAIETARGNHAAASRLVAEILYESPRDSDALLIDANLAMERNDLSSEIVDLRAVIRDQPKQVAVYRMLARAHLAKGETALAEELLRSAVSAVPEDASSRIELAEFLAQTDRVAQAISVLRETVQRVPDNVQAREALVRALLAQGNLNAAQTAAEDYRKMAAAAAGPYLMLGAIAQKQRHWEDAERALRRAYELEPTIDNLQVATQLELGRERPQAAIAVVMEALKRDPHDADRQQLLGELYLSAKDFAQARDVLSRARTLHPDRWMLYRDLASLKADTNDLPGAIAECESGLKVAPAEPQLVQQAALLDEKAGHIDAAIAKYDVLYRDSPRNRQFAANNLAMLLVTYKRDGASLDRALALTKEFSTSQDPALLDTHGWVRFKRGQYEEALTALQRAESRSPDSRVIRYHLGMTELQLGHLERARAALEFAVAGPATFVGSSEARSALASLRQSTDSG